MKVKAREGKGRKDRKGKKEKKGKGKERKRKEHKLRALCLSVFCQPDTS